MVKKGCKYSRFRVSFKREKCPPPLETAAGKRQTWGKLGHVTLSAVHGEKYAVPNLSNDGGGVDDNNIFTHFCVSDIP